MKRLSLEKVLITTRDSRSIEIYLSEIEKIPLLKPEEEFVLAKLSREGDFEATEKLVKSNLRFVVSVAKKYQFKNVPLIDLINEGNIGLLEAAKRFDETRGFKFISYAVWWIRQSIMQSLSEHSKIVRLPSNKSTIFTKVRNAKESFESINEREPTFEELEDILKETSDVNLRDIKDSFELGQNSLSLDKPLTEGGDSSFLDVYINKDDSSIEDSMDLEFNNSKILSLISYLTTKEKIVIVSSFGIGQEARSLESIAEDMNLSRERVRQIKEKGLKRMRYYSRKNNILSFV